MFCFKLLRLGRNFNSITWKRIGTYGFGSGFVTKNQPKKKTKNKKWNKKLPELIQFWPNTFGRPNDFCHEQKYQAIGVYRSLNVVIVYVFFFSRIVATSKVIL